MLLCKACNTRFADGKSACPSCGRRSFASVREASSPGSTGELTKLPPPPDPDESGTDLRDEPATDVDLELGEVDVLAAAIELEATDGPKADPPRVSSHRHSPDVEPGPAVLHLSAAQVRTLVAERPQLLHPGLSVYRDEKKGVGVDLRTPVGAIDLLARDAEGDFVVVMIPDPRDVESLMPDMLARIGYVRKHLAPTGKEVRGVVVIEEIPEELAYAAAGVGATLSFRSYRVALSFHPLEI